MSVGSVAEVRHAREMLGFDEDALLRSKGWKHTSSTPGCLWLWERKLDDGRTLLVDKSTALAIQEHFEREAMGNAGEYTEDGK